MLGSGKKRPGIHHSHGNCTQTAQSSFRYLAVKHFIPGKHSHGLFLKITVRLIPRASPMPLRRASARGMHFWASVLFPFDHTYYLLTSPYARCIFCRLFQNCSRMPIDKQINISEMNERTKCKHLVNCMTAVVMTNHSPPIAYPCSQSQPQWHSPPLKLLGGS